MQSDLFTNLIFDIKVMSDLMPVFTSIPTLARFKILHDFERRFFREADARWEREQLLALLKKCSSLEQSSLRSVEMFLYGARREPGRTGDMSHWRVEELR